QGVLEYLRVRHDEEIRPPKTTGKPEKPLKEDDHDDQADVNALYAAVNDLPKDDPLRAAPEETQPGPVAQSADTSASSKQTAVTAADKHVEAEPASAAKSNPS